MSKRRFAATAHDRLHAEFRWQVPPDFNIGHACCGRWAADPAHRDRVAVRWEDDGGASGSLSYGEMQDQADRLAAALRRIGVVPGDRVAIVLPQCSQTAVAHIAIYQLGAVAMPLSMLFGPEALAYRLQDSGAKVAIVDAQALAAVAALRPECPALQTVVSVGAGAAQGDLSWQAALGRRSGRFKAASTRADDAAVLIYTSGTTGPPKGALIPHRALIGNLSGFVCSQNWFAAGADGGATVFWSPADWAWTGGLMDALLPTLYFGGEILGYRGRFGPEKAFELMQRHGVTHSFLFPTALKAMMKAVPAPRTRYRLRLQALMSAGEAVGSAVFDWCRDELGVGVNEMFGQTEI
ncbi:MAG: AMP-binding protein, partial [Rubrivivax sp.]|nr:AMP-binding protein [Rubrivivax sp.]